MDWLQVDANSGAYINSIGTTDHLKADFGSGTWNGYPIGIPYNIVSGSQAKVPVIFEYAGESDPGGYPIPPNPLIEGDPDCCDRHMLILDQNNCILYETWDTRQENGVWHAGSGAVFDLGSNALRPDTWTSADAAGLPILPGLVRYDEVAAGEIPHAIRFTVNQTQRAYVWPARHFASSLTGVEYPPLGQRFRLKVNYDISSFSAENQVILQALKKYGLILADNGSDWFMSGVPDPRWDNDDLQNLRDIPGSAFEAVDTSILRIHTDSGQAHLFPYRNFLPLTLR